MKLDLIWFRIIIVRLPVVPVHNHGPRGPARSLHRRITWKKHLDGNTLEEAVMPYAKTKLSNQEIALLIQREMNGRPLADTEETDRRIRQTVSSVRSRMK